MYWIYLIIFTLVVFIPDIVTCGVWGLPEEKTEEGAIFFLGMVAFYLFIIKDSQLNQNIKKRLDIQEKYNAVYRDLTESYSYIGEVNRKLEILENISLRLVDTSKINRREKKEIEGMIVEAIRFFAKTNKFVIRFKDHLTNQLLSQIDGGDDDFSLKTKNLFIVMHNSKSITRQDGFLIVRSARNIKNVTAFLVFEEKGEKLPENIEMIQVLATQALLMYNLGRKF
jgi:hypothetical protein